MSTPGPDPAARPRRRVRARWLGEYRVELDVRDGRFTLLSDESLSDGGDDAGPMPSELLFASVASCFAMAVAWAARKTHVELPDLDVAVNATPDREGRRYRAIEIETASSLGRSDPERFGRLLHLAEQVCWITRTIEPGIAIVVRAAPVAATAPADVARGAAANVAADVAREALPEPDRSFQARQDT